MTKQKRPVHTLNALGLQTAITTIIAMVLGLVVIPVTSAASPAGDGSIAPQEDNAASQYPYDKTFIVSAYYSPIPNQKKYVTGSYKGDIRLNGAGVHGADGSDVYPGMIAAPKSYPFGMKLKIPGIGVVAVHDRGGAIVLAGERNQAHDRLDVWMGYGDVGLKRALNWGRRTVAATVYGIDDTVKEEVYLEGYSEAEKIAEAATDGSSDFNQDLGFSDKSDDVKKLQEGLKKLGYYSADANGQFDGATEQAVVQFQIDVGIVDGINDFGAGYFGPQTRHALDNALNRKDLQIREHLPQTPLSKDDQGDEVKKLQEALKKLGYGVKVTGVYDNQTIDAIFKFQQDQNIITSEADRGAGTFGPKTMLVLAGKLSGVTFDTVNAESGTYSPVIVFHHDLKPGDKGDDVRRLQEELTKLHFLGVDPSGFYGEVTEHAVFKFQQSQGIVTSAKDQGAGYLGPATRDRFHAIIGQRDQVNRLIVENTPAKKEDAVALK